MSKELYEKLEVGQMARITGEVNFSAITKVIDGEELKREIKRQEEFTDYPVTVPHTKISITNPQVDKKSDKELKAYLEEKFYENKDGVSQYNHISKSPFIPYVVYEDQKITLEKELDKGVEVALYITTFETGNRKIPVGIGLGCIEIIGELRYYEGTTALDKSMKHFK